MESSAEDGKPGRAVAGGAFAFAALTPPGEPDPSIAIAASRAGEIGVLNLEYARDEQAALAAVDRLASAVGNRRFGVLVDGADAELVQALLRHPRAHPPIVFVSHAGLEEEQLRERLEWIH